METDIFKFNCNCCKEWSEKCKSRTSWLGQCSNLEFYPAQYWLYYPEYESEGIISGTKNDIVLYNYLIDNNILGEKFCYLGIAHKLVLEDYKYDKNRLEENVDSMLDYLCYSYGEPNDTDNLLRKYFVKKAMRDNKCNCKENWECVCKKYTERGLTYMDDDLHMVPCSYMIYFDEYGKRGIISQRKNDEFLYEYICKNNLLEDELCYYDLAYKLCIRDSNDPLIKYESNIKFLIDYLVWSYGLPYDENNILRKILKNNNNIDISNYKYKPKDKKEFNNITVKGAYVRDARVRELALQLANFQCEIDKEHNTFISKAILKNYVESHHLIPMKYYDEFQYSIDNEADIVALCPNCHRLLHFGRFEDKKVLLEKLYYKHIESLKKAGIEITLERLLEMYKD
ncbi:HNH endonuclease [Clostridium saccharoperbutylacetonicum]|uniref:HNH endonuclease n=1 Tax=Clostridium saccharoperbutylacetonicum TaxID=36745 RepID=UPI0039EBE94F